MTVEVLASGSSGNCTAIYSATGLLLIDCGMPIMWTLARLGGRLPDAILITHEHGDHSKAVKKFIKRGVDIILTQGTREALDIEHYNLFTIKAGDTLKVAGVEVEVLPSIHDAAEPVNFILSDEVDRVLFVTDTGAIPEVAGEFTKIFIEANYSEPSLLSSDIDAGQKRRILQNHLSVEQVENFLKHYPKAAVELIHMSKRHGKEIEQWLSERK